MKRSRQKAILTILNQRRITTQEQLRDALLEQGIRVTQATLSRDIAELGLTKDENGYGLPRAGGNAMGGSKGVAGDDTVLIVVRSAEAAEALRDHLLEMLG